MSDAMIRNQRGITLIDSLIGIVLLGASAMALATLIHFLNQAMARQQVKWTSERISATVIEMVSLPATLRSSISQTDTEEARTLFRELRGWKSSRHLGPWTGMRMYLPFVDKTGPASFVVGGVITGSPSYPVRYNLRGEVCDTEIASCLPADWPVEAVTEYNFSCPPLFHSTYDDTLRGGLPFADAIYPDGLVIPNRCIGKGNINIRVTVRESADVTNPARGLFKTKTEIIAITPASVFFP